MPGVSLTQVVDMNQDHAMAAKWLSENVEDVLHDLNRCHNLDMGNAELHGLLSSQKIPDAEKIQMALKFLEDECE